MLLEIITSSAIASTIIGFLLSKWIESRLRGSINHEYDMKIEQLKSEMAKDAALAIERFKSEQSMRASKDQYAYQSSYNSISEVMAKVYALLVVFRESVEDFVSLFQGPEVHDSDNPKATDVAKAMDDLYRYYSSNKIFLPLNIQEGIENLIDKLKKKAFDFRMKVVDKFVNSPSESYDTWQEVDKYMENELPKLLRAMESQMQIILGIDLHGR